MNFFSTSVLFSMGRHFEISIDRTSLESNSPGRKISITRDSVSSGYPYTEKRVENT